MIVGRYDEQWRERHAAKLTTPADAVRLVESGQNVYVGGWTSVPLTLCRALAARSGELRDVTIDTYLTPYNWDDAKLLESFRVRTFYIGPNERAAVHAGRFDYVPIAQWRVGEPPPGFAKRIDVAMIPISPPDANGYCSFGSGAWFSPTISNYAKTLVAEVHPEFIRTGGQNFIHISKFARLTEIDVQPAPPPIAPRSEETEI